jgi:branched-subunit amino acid ABC-type transport system permease component
VLQLTHAVGFGLVTAAVLALGAAGATLQLGITNFANFAYGDFLTFGAYITYAGHTQGLTLALAALVGATSTAILAVVLNLAIFNVFSKRGVRVLTMLIVGVGVSFIVQQAILMIWGSGARTYGLAVENALHIGPFLLTPANLVTIGAAALVLVLLSLGLRYTRFGKSLRAMSNNSSLAEACGINTNRITNWVWAISGFLGGLAGVGLVMQVGSMSPTVGFGSLFLVYAAVILGGAGHPLGAMIGALVMGLTEQVSGSYLVGGWNVAIVFGVLVAVVLLRPQGIFASRGRIA